MRAFPGTGNGMAVRASGIQQLFSAPFQVRLLSVGKLRENGSGTRNERQVDGGTHASGSSLNEASNRGGYSEKGVFLRSDTALCGPKPNTRPIKTGVPGRNLVTHAATQPTAPRIAMP